MDDTKPKALALFVFSLSWSWLGFNPIAVSAQTSSFRFQQTPGPYQVGLKVVDQYDPLQASSASGKVGTRSELSNGRPLQTLIWYPSEKNSGNTMTVGDYAQLADTETHFNTPDRNANRWRALLKTSFDVPLWAGKDAKPTAGHYPVVIYAPSDSSVSWENADLCEYLASYGYVVIASPSMGVSTRDMTDDLQGIDAQAHDISFLISYASSLPDADLSKVAVMSWSWGGLSSLFAAARDSRIDALVEMDGSMRYYPGLVKRAAGVRPDQMTIPLLFFTRNVSPEVLEKAVPPEDATGPNVLNAWLHGDLITINMLGMAHPEFSSMFQRRENAQRFSENQFADYDREDANTSYSWVALYTLKFFKAYLNDEPDAKAFLEKTPAQNDVPRHFVDVKVRFAEKAPHAKQP